MSVNDVVERSIMFFLEEHGKPSKLTNTPEFITALTKMQSSQDAMQDLQSHLTKMVWRH